MSLVIQHGETIEPSPEHITQAAKLAAYRKHEVISRAAHRALNALVTNSILDDYEAGLSHR